MSEHNESGKRLVPLPEDQPFLGLQAAAAIFDIGKTKAYSDAASGSFPVEVLHIGGRLKVRTIDVRRLVGLDAGTRDFDASA